MKKVLVVFPTDPLFVYFKKGEIKERYYNPCDFFDEVHAITLADPEEEIDPGKVKVMAGSAEFYIHPVGRMKAGLFLTGLKKVIEIVREIKPSVIRAYDPVFRGYIALKVSQALKCPLIVSVHTDFDRTMRPQVLREKNIKKILFYYFASPLIERIVLKRADWVIAVYDFAYEYVLKRRKDKVSLILNRVYKSFRKGEEKAFDFSVPTVIWVGAMKPVKNHQLLIRAMRYFRGNLILVGDGPLRNDLENLARDLGVERRVFFTGAIKNEELYRYYNSADMLVSPSLAAGLSIPIIEAMACGLAIGYISFRGEIPSILKDVCVELPSDPRQLGETLNHLFRDRMLIQDLRRRSLACFNKISGEKMEEMEKKVYETLLR